MLPHEMDRTQLLYHHVRLLMTRFPFIPLSSGTAACEYLPGEVECCPSTEYCIPNVGCRC